MLHLVWYWINNLANNQTDNNMIEAPEIEEKNDDKIEKKIEKQSETDNKVMITASIFFDGIVLDLCKEYSPFCTIQLLDMGLKFSQHVAGRQNLNFFLGTIAISKVLNENDSNKQFTKML